MPERTREEIYDAEIAPLMSQIIAICKANHIAMVATYSLDREEGLLCTTVLLEEAYEPPECFLAIARALLRPAVLTSFAIVTRPADGEGGR